MKKYIVIEDNKEDGTFYIGTFESYFTALGRLMDDVFDLYSNYDDPGDIFEIGELFYMNGDGGYRCDVRFRKEAWEKKIEHSFFILLDDEEGPKKACDLPTAEEAFKRSTMRMDERIIEEINSCIERGETSCWDYSVSISDDLRERLNGMGYSVDTSCGVRIDWRKTKEGEER